MHRMVPSSYEAFAILSDLFISFGTKLCKHVVAIPMGQMVASPHSATDQLYFGTKET